MKKVRISIAIVVIILLNIIFIPSIVGASDPNYAEALQKSLYFYDAEKCGSGITGGKLEWRGDCHLEDSKIPLDSEHTNLSESFISQNKEFLDPDGDEHLDLSGGYHDAGDHVKFGLPQSYSGSTLAWAYYEFKEAFVQIGEDEHMMDILKGFSDYFLKSTFLNDNGEVIAFNFMVGDGDIDHTYWGPPELQQAEKYPRPATFATVDTPASDQCGNVAADLVAMHLILKDSEPDYAEQCLETAKALYEFGRNNRGLGDSGGYYGSAYDHDELSWAATWLYEATGNMDYIDHIMSKTDDGIYDGYLQRIIKSEGNTWQNIWVHCWDVVWGGTFMKLSSLFPENEMYDYFARWNIEYWSGGEIKHEDESDGTYLQLTPYGYGMINTWGSARYNSAAQMCALVYQKHHPDRTDFGEWARGQMEYILGDNKVGYSMEVGYGNAYVQHPHHRAAHGSKTNSMLNPPEHKHILWGALAGGPDGDDEHVDETTDYVYNEVAIDYNAGFVGALAGHYLLYGQSDEPIADFPPLEPDEDKFYCESKIEQENNERTQVTLKIHNETYNPPAFEDGLMCRYFFDISELLEAGQTIDDISLDIYYDEEKSITNHETILSGPHKWNNEGLYYVELDWAGAQIYGDREIQVAIMATQDSSWNSNWDPSNDFSREGITEEMALNNNVPVYIDGELVYGVEPAKSEYTPDSSTGTEITPTPTLTPETIDVDVKYSVENDWETGSVIEVTLTNNGESNITNWTISWNYSGNQEIINYWNANLIQNGPEVIFSNTSSSTSIAAGESESFGFQISHSGTNEVPSNFEIY
ncbi:MAG: glycoside hydrolase family 9 protein [Clostridiales bacterium]